MAIESTAPSRPQPEPSPDDDERAPRRISPEISEVLHLLGAMERLIEDAAERQSTADDGLET